MRFPALLAPVLFTTLVFTASTRADEVDLGPPVPQERLDQLRGGFDLPTGLSVAFGFERTVTVNGQTVVTQSVNIPDVSKITPDQVSQLSALTQGKTVQIGGTSGGTTVTTPGSTTVTTPSVVSTPTPTTVPTATVVTTPATPAVTTPTTPVVTTPTASVVTTPTMPTTPNVATTVAPTDTTPTLVPNGGTTITPTAGPTITPNTDIALIPNMATAITPNLGTLIIQNSLDGQTIQAMTSIHAAVNTLTLLHDIHFTQSLGDSLRLGGTP